MGKFAVYHVQNKIKEGEKLTEKVLEVRRKVYLEPENGKSKEALNILGLSIDDIETLSRYLQGSTEYLKNELENTQIEIKSW